MAFLFTAAFVLATAAPQDLELKNAHVYTGTDKTWDGPVVVVGGHIQPPGTAAPAGARSVDLGGAFVYPGLQDAHGHLLGLATAMEAIDLGGCSSYEEVIERVKKVADKTPKGDWIFGRGWDQNRWRRKEMPHHADLSADTPDHPVLLYRVDGHALLANMYAMRSNGVLKENQAPEGGQMLLGDDGEPTGVLIDRAMDMIAPPDPSRDQVRARWLAAQQVCFRNGLTCVHDAGVGRHDFDELHMLHAAGKWQLRTYTMFRASEVDAIRKGPWQSRDGLINARAVKGMADGALGSRGAALLEPYSDQPGRKGLLTTPKAMLQQTAQLCADKGMQFCVHAIGDAGNRTVLDVFAAVKWKASREAARWRIEHAQVVAPADFVRFKELAVIPSMQPTHLTSDMPWAPARLGPERIKGAYAWQSFLALGLPVAFGSDFPVESPDPRKGLFAAATTRSESGGPAEGWRPEQKLDRKAMLQRFTADAAYAMFAENELGSIAPGKLGDFTVFDRDLLTCKDEELLVAKVVLTVINGKVVYEAGK